MAKKGIYNKIIASLMLVLFIFYYANNNLFLHSHVINGIIVVHSHFHNDKHHSHKSGDHTTNDVNLIEHLSNFQSLSPSLLCSEFKPNIFRSNLLFPKATAEFNFGYAGFISLRAPPVL